MKKYSLLATGLLLLSHSLATPLAHAAEWTLTIWCRGRTCLLLQR